MIYYLYPSKIGTIQITIDNLKVSNLKLWEQEFKAPKIVAKSLEQASSKEKELLAEVIQQFSEYFAKKRKYFDFPLTITSSKFGEKVYRVLLKTEYGQTYTYQEIAKLAGSPRAYRAVGTALKNNPLALVIPCHRVIKSTGEYGHFFHNDWLKEYLIKLEKN